MLVICPKRGVHRGIRHVEMRSIEQVERFHPELRMPVLVDGDVFLQAEVDVMDAGAANSAIGAANISERVSRGKTECAGIEPFVYLLPVGTRRWQARIHSGNCIGAISEAGDWSIERQRPSALFKHNCRSIPSAYNCVGQATKIRAQQSAAPEGKWSHNIRNQ